MMAIGSTIIASINHAVSSTIQAHSLKNNLHVA
jgi:hypothetical protein